MTSAIGNFAKRLATIAELQSNEAKRQSEIAEKQSQQAIDAKEQAAAIKQELMDQLYKCNDRVEELEKDNE